MTTHVERPRLTALFLFTLLAVGAPLRAGQQAPDAALTDSRWRAWIGCWMPAGRSEGDRDIRLCLVPAADGRGVRSVTLADEVPVFEETIVPGAPPQPHVENGCTGERRSSWSSDGQRLYSQSELRCAGEPVRRSAGISAMVGATEWLDLQLATMDGTPQVRVRRYARLFTGWPAALADQAPPMPTAPIELRTSMTAADIGEAHRTVGAAATEAWLFEADVRVPINARVLRQLSADGVSEPVLDLLIARAYPKRFEVHEPTRSAGGGWDLDNLLWNATGAVDPYAMYYSPFDPFFNQWWWLTGYVPVIPAPPDGQTQPVRRAQVINGVGYAQIRERQAEGGHRGSAAGGASSSSGDASSAGDSSSASVSSGGYSGGGSATGLTAVPR